MLRITGAVAATALVLAAVPAISATADVSLRPGKPKVNLAVPADVVEGEQFKVEGQAQPGRRRQAGAAGAAGLRPRGHALEAVGKAKAKKKKKYQFTAVGGEADTLAYRARVVYHGRQAHLFGPVPRARSGTGSRSARSTPTPTAAA